ncbi:MAG: phosphatase PAP2 family protein [Bacteroidota bacterium]|nr:phosphatase PAP2 family protein [Bacteroidota bacterium]
MHFSAITFWQRLLQLDQQLFEKINSDWSNPFFDTVMPLLRNSLTWIPLYTFLLIFLLLNFKVKGIWWSVLFLCTIALTDMTGTYGFKHVLERPRPCNDPAFTDHVRLLLRHCSGGFSFVSNHAANHFGMAAFFFVTFRHIFKKWAWAGLFWAGSIGYAQVYVGVHYPLDVVGGALLGLAFGISFGTIFNKRFGFATFGNQPAG